jgi:L-asparaginase
MLLLANDEGAPGVQETVRRLRAGAAALDAIEAGIRIVEADPKVRTVGCNSWPNLIGELELDAAVMDGRTLRTGAVGALRGFRHPISVARKVMEELPFEIMVGAGAARFAAEIGAEAGINETAEGRAALQEFLARNGTADELARWPDGPLVRLARKSADPQGGGAPGEQRDTTVYIAQDATRNLCVGASTSGWAWKYPGRLGDTPIVGAGSYAIEEYGAAACTHTGEMTIRAETAHAVVLYMKTGMPLDRAVDAAIDDLRRLRSGLIADVTIHACDPGGRHRVVHAHVPGQDYWSRWGVVRYWLWTEAMAEPELRPAEMIAL